MATKFVVDGTGQAFFHLRLPLASAYSANLTGWLRNAPASTMASDGFHSTARPCCGKGLATNGYASTARDGATNGGDRHPAAFIRFCEHPPPASCVLPGNVPPMGSHHRTQPRHRYWGPLDELLGYSPGLAPWHSGQNLHHIHFLRTGQ